MAAIARLGDTSSHGGTIVSASPDFTVDDIPVARNGDLHQCPQSGHGTTSITAITTRTIVNGQLVLTVGAVAGCGAIINSGSPTTDVE